MSSERSIKKHDSIRRRVGQAALTIHAVSKRAAREVELQEATPIHFVCDTKVNLLENRCNLTGRTEQGSRQSLLQGCLAKPEPRWPHLIVTLALKIKVSCCAHSNQPRWQCPQ